ncbi:Aspartyl protease [Globisporangium polare]
MVRVMTSHSVAAAVACAVSLLASACTSGVQATSAVAFPQGMTLELHRVAETSHSESYRRRRMQDVDGKMGVVPLNPGLGTHYAWVYAGTPPQRASVIADTGSSLMAFPCSGCTGCGEHTDEPFAALNSSTLTHVTCGDANPFFKCKSCSELSNMCSISQAYMEGSSWDATVVDDIVFLGGDNSSHNEHVRDQFGTRFMFGCQNKETGLFISQVADGIMGLANNDNNLVAKLYKEKKIPSKLFSLCFADGGGSMSMGVPDTARHKGEIEYAKLAPDTSHTDFYNVNVRDIRVGNVSIDAPQNSFIHGHFIVDSGTTDSYLPSSMKKPFEAAFEKVTGLKYQASGGGCKGYTNEQLDALPNIQVVLEAENGDDLVLQVTPDQYLIQEQNKFCANIFLTEFSGGVIGANIMLDRDVIFDSGNNRVGFVEADCAYRNLETSADVTPASSTTPSEGHPPGVVASSETEKATSSPSPAPEPTTVAPTPVPTSAPPTTAPTSRPEPTLAPSTPKPTAASSTPSPVADAAVDFDSEKSVAPTTSSPAPTTNPASSATTHKDHETTETVDEHPMVLTVVGTILVAVFLLVVVASIKLKGKKKDHNWSRVKENEEDEDDEEEGLGSHARPSKNAHGKHQLRSDEVGSDDDDDEEDEDEIFDRSAHEDTKHDTRMLERL